MPWFSVGLSSYPDLKGQEQFTNSQRIADQFWSLATEMQAFLPKGWRLSVNEARRSRARQIYLWDNRKALGIVVANPYTSRHDEVTHGNALDIGMTHGDGSNSTLPDAAWNELHTRAEKRGFTWTGRNFGEVWHIEGATRNEVYPPYPNARVVADAAYAASIATPAPTPIPEPSGDDDMANLIWNWTNTSDPHHGDVWIIDGYRAAIKTKDANDIYQQGRTFGILAAGESGSAFQSTAIKTITGELQARLKAIAKAGGYVDPAGKDLI